MMVNTELRVRGSLPFKPHSSLGSKTVLGGSESEKDALW